MSTRRDPLARTTRYKHEPYQAPPDPPKTKSQESLPMLQSLRRRAAAFFGKNKKKGIQVQASVAPCLQPSVHASNPSESWDHCSVVSSAEETVVEEAPLHVDPFASADSVDDWVLDVISELDIDMPEPVSRSGAENKPTGVCGHHPADLDASPSASMLASPVQEQERSDSGLDSTEVPALVIVPYAGRLYQALLLDTDTVETMQGAVEADHHWQAALQTSRFLETEVYQLECEKKRLAALQDRPMPGSFCNVADEQDGWSSMSSATDWGNAKLCSFVATMNV